MDLVSQNLLLTSGGGKKSTFVDDVFSTYIWDGNATAGRSINNGIDFAGEGGAIWIKARNQGYSHRFWDTTRGATKFLYPDETHAEATDVSGAANMITSFDSNGVTLGQDSTYGGSNYSGANYVSWSFRKQKGFFDVVTWTGDGTNPRQIPHNLGCVPGFVMIKCTSHSHAWACYHRDSIDKLLELNSDFSGNSSIWKNTTATDAYITVDNQQEVNGGSKTYVGYFFAGGESTAATATSVDFDGSGDYLSLASTSDLAFGTGDYTVECWVKPEGTSGSLQILFSSGGAGNDTFFFHYALGQISVGNQNAYISNQSFTFTAGQWYHLAACRSGTTLKLFVNGIQIGSSVTDNTNWASNGEVRIGSNSTGSQYVDGKISNLRVVKGTAVYTSSFKPPTEPLTNITNTKLLCCNNSSTTGSTVTPGTITANGNPTASTDSPLDDPEGFKFGEEENQNIIKCGSYKGSGSSGLEVNIGWEPSWLLIRVITRTGDWYIVDSMRGVVSNGNDQFIKTNENDAEGSADVIDFTPTGFKVISTGTHWNNSAHTYSYVAIRRPDGYVGKPAEVGTDAFAMDGSSNGSNVFPQFTSGFPVDISLTRNPTSTGTWESWHTGARLLQKKYQLLDDNDAWNTGNNFMYDYNDGIFIGSWAGYMSWMWKRHAGCDVITYNGNGAIREIPHSLGRAPEMMWIKRRDTGGNNWQVYHKGANGGTNPEQYYFYLNLDASESNQYAIDSWNNTAPTATHFTLGNDGNVNNGSSGRTYIAMLFASVDDISKVGYYNGSNYGQTITTGFQPRFVIIKAASTTGQWNVLDTVRGWGAGNDPYLKLNSQSGQVSGYDIGAPTSTGFTLTGNMGGTNVSGVRYIYYAHA